MAINEYLEKTTAEAFKREWDHEENVNRSLTFSTASLAVLATAIGFIIGKLPVAGGSTYFYFVWGLLLLLAFFICGALLFLFLSVRTRKFLYPINENELLEYADKLIAYYKSLPSGQQKDDAAILAEIRLTVAKRYAEATRVNRINNIARQVARARCNNSLIICFLITFILVGTILTHSLISDSSRTSPNNVPSETVKPKETNGG